VPPTVRRWFPLLVTALAACSPRAALPVAEPPAFEPTHESKCQVTKDHAKPLVVEWPASARGDLEARARSGAIVVRYSGCTMDVLDACTAPGRYTYQAFTPKEDRVRIVDATSLYANLPLGAPQLEAKLAKSGELDVAMTVVGRWASDRPFVRADQLTGACSGATHVLVGLTAGAFDFYAGGEAEARAGLTVLGVGAAGSARERRETLSRDGDAQACARWTADDHAPPAGCGAVLRVETLPIVDPPKCPEGTEWNGDACHAARVVMTTVECPLDSIWNGTACVGVVTCPPGTDKQVDGSCRGRIATAAGVTLLSPSRDARVTTWGGPLPAPEPPAPRVEPAGTFACDGESIETCRTQCQRGNSMSCNTLGEMYRDGRGVARDPGAALLAFTDACMAKNARACANIGRAYAVGDGIQKDATSAAKWLAIACKNGHTEACS
jgi:hypothetical protein